jgi:hypothetical protein
MLKPFHNRRVVQKFRDWYCRVCAQNYRAASCLASVGFEQFNTCSHAHPVRKIIDIQDPKIKELTWCPKWCAAALEYQMS